eukprot:scaffold118416_cov69-Phaeocystis_antarctica.AAC.3
MKARCRLIRVFSWPPSISVPVHPARHRPQVLEPDPTHCSSVLKPSSAKVRLPGPSAPNSLARMRAWPTCEVLAKAASAGSIAPPRWEPRRCA